MELYGPHRDDHASQHERFPEALAPGYVQIDGRTPQQLIAFFPAFAHLLHFFDLANEPDGDWAPFVEADVSVLLAEMATVDTRANHYLSLELSRRIEAGQFSHEDYRRVVHRGREIFGQIDRWYMRAQALAGEQGVAYQIENMLATAIREELAPLRALFDDESNGSDTDRSVPMLRGRYGRIMNLAMPFRLIHPATTSKVDEERWAHVVSLFRQLNAFVRHLAEIAVEYLVTSLEQAALVDHAPQTALLLAFVRLLRHHQRALNQIPDKHLDFYYRDILRLEERRPTPDSAHVYVVPAKGTRQLLLEAGTALSAGTDANGEAIVYETQDERVVTAASIASVRRLFFETETHVPPADKTSPAKPVTHVVAAYAFDGTEGTGPSTEAAGWATFGEAVPDAAGETCDARMGLAIASSVLLLREGRRDVNITFVLADDPAPPFQAYVHRLEQAYEPGTRTFAWKDQKMLLPADVLRLSLSGAKAWIPVTDYQLVADAAGNRLVLSFALEATEEPVVAYGPHLPGNALETSLPVCKIEVNPDARVYPYDFFDQIAIRRTTIDVQVRGLTTLNLQNENGPVDATKPFRPFGPVPVLGSYLSMRNEELTTKALTGLKVAIDWFNIPPATKESIESGGTAGFETYYAAYELGTTNASFQARMMRRHQRHWVALPGAEQPLFRQSADTSLSTATTFAYDMSASPAAPIAVLDEQVEAREPAPPGTLRLALAAPSYAFGHDVYPAVVSRVSLDNAIAISKSVKDDAAAQETTPPPNPPFVPVASGVTVDYEATRVVETSPALTQARGEASRDQLFLLLPFGEREQPTTPFRFVPRYGGDGSLFLGLDGAAGGDPLALYFEIADRYVEAVSNDGEADAGTSAVQWSYLAGDQWTPFDVQAIASDTTRGFTRSGIVLLRLPAVLPATGTTMPAGMTWLRASTERDAASFGRTLALHTHGVRVTRVMNGAAAPPPAGLPAYSITGPVQKQPKLKKVVQPFPSWGFVPAEDTEGYRARVSERLRHKQRSIQPWDYERLVLDRFPDIETAKCITYNRSTDDYPGLVDAGDVIVTVVPRIPERHPQVEPMLPQEVLRAVGTYLRRYTTPFVKRLVVRNPGYEYLKVRARVAFTGDETTGYNLSRLEHDLSRFIAPWMHDPAEEIVIGGEAFPVDRLLGYVEGLPYVAVVSGFSVEHVYRVGHVYRLFDSARSAAPRPAIRVTTPWGVFLPMPGHAITVVDRDEDRLPPDKSGIGNLVVETDFIITKERKGDSA